MRVDLLEAQASIDWPRSQLADFQRRLDTWVSNGVHIEIRQLDPPATTDRIVAVEKELLPIAFSVEERLHVLRDEAELRSLLRLCGPGE